MFSSLLALTSSEDNSISLRVWVWFCGISLRFRQLLSLLICFSYQGAKLLHVGVKDYLSKNSLLGFIFITLAIGCLLFPAIFSYLHELALIVNDSWGVRSSLNTCVAAYFVLGLDSMYQYICRANQKLLLLSLSVSLFVYGARLFFHLLQLILLTFITTDYDRWLLLVPSYRVPAESWANDGVALGWNRPETEGLKGKVWLLLTSLIHVWQYALETRGWLEVRGLLVVRSYRWADHNPVPWWAAALIVVHLPKLSGRSIF